MKRITVVIANVLTVALLGSIYAVQYFTDRKLGMVRWLNHRSAKIGDALPVGSLEIVVLGVLLVLAILALKRLWMHRANLRVAATVNACFMVATLLAYAICIFAVTRAVTKAYLLILLILAAAALVQVLLGVCRNYGKAPSRSK